jgi:hypothetical protein
MPISIGTKGQAELKNIDTLITQIERNPSSYGAYDKFIDAWKSSNWVQSKDLFSGGYYDRILKICEKNSTGVKAWQMLHEVIQKLKLAFEVDLTGKRNKAKTFRFLADSLLKEFTNELIRERIVASIHLLSGLTQAETQDLYNTALKILEKHPSSQEAKVLVLDLGRLHYSVLRPNKTPTIYDEQAIQNDIIVRAK